MGFTVWVRDNTEVSESCPDQGEYGTVRMVYQRCRYGGCKGIGRRYSDLSCFLYYARTMECVREMSKKLWVMIGFSVTIDLFYKNPPVYIRKIVNSQKL